MYFAATQVENQLHVAEKFGNPGHVTHIIDANA